MPGKGGRLSSAGPVFGYIDVWSDDHVEGWAIDLSQPDNLATVALLINGQPAALVNASSPREDVAAAGFPSSRCGFRIALDGRLGASAQRPVLAFWPSGIRIEGAPYLRPARSDALDQASAPTLQDASARLDASVLIEGPMKGDYSLAIVNRELARCLVPLARRVTCTSDEAGLDEDRLFRAATEVVARFEPAARSKDYDVHSFNSWPPDSRHMRAGLNVLHCYAWEESEFPPNFAAEFNARLGLVCTTSEYTRIALENAGVTVPVVTIGNGIDHLLATRPEPVAGLAADRFRFLHVSSCFPRKGADVLLRAFAEEFGADEPVELLIKTFNNVHNTVEADLAALRAGTGRLPAARICKEPFSAGQMRWLYESSQCLVAPSRGEGFLLPAAEAMLLHVPVITTAHGGQLDFCTEETAWLVSVTLGPSASHMGLRNSLWAEPDLASLRARMREV